MSNDEIIVVRETPPNVEKQVNEIIIERGAGVGPPGEFPALNDLGSKPVVVATDLALTGDSAASFSNKKSTWQQIIDSVLSLFVVLAGKPGGQTINGGTLTGEDLTIQDNGVDGNSITVTEIIAGLGGEIDYSNPTAANSTSTITPSNGDYFTSTSKLITLIGSAGEVFEPAESSETSRIIWGRGVGNAITLTVDTSSLGVGDVFSVEADNGESRILMLNSVGDLVKVGGVVMSLSCDMHNNRPSLLSIANGTLTTLPLDVTDSDPSGQMADPTTNKRINIIRGGKYIIAAGILYGDTSSTHTKDHETQTRINIDGSVIFNDFGYIHAAQNLGFANSFLPHNRVLSAGNFLQLIAFHVTVGGSESLNVFGPQDAGAPMHVLEVDPW